MNILMLLFALWARPEAPPVGPAEAAAALALEARNMTELRGTAIRFPPRKTVAVPLCRNSDCVPSRPIPGSRTPGRYVVGYEPGCLDQVRQAVEACGAMVVRVDSVLGFVVCRDETDRLELLLAAKDGIRYVESDVRMRAAKIPDDPYFLRYQWDKWVMYSDKAWDITVGNASVKVAVCDNGVEYWHADLAARYVPGEYGYDFVNGDNDPRPDNPGLPEAFHGTHVAGIIGAVMDNSTGVAGWAQVRLYGVKVLNDSGTGDLSDLASGIRWAADNGCRVVNMSLGADASISPVEEACAYAAARGVVLVAAAGNQSLGRVQYPAALPECICVGATDEYSGLAEFSNYGPQQEVVAPGVQVVSPVPGGSYAQASGTSMASPEVAGVAGLVFSANNSLSAVRVRAIIAASAIDMGASGRDERYGHGLVNAFRALGLAVFFGGDRWQAASAPGVRAGVSRGKYRLPDWAEEGSVYDAQGRLVLRLEPANSTVALKPGTYFVALTGAGRAVRAKLVVVR